MSDAERLYRQSLESFRLGRPPEAISRLEEALRLDPRHADVMEALGIMYEKAGRLDDAIAMMKRLALASPNHIMAHTNLSRFYVQKGMILEAEQEQAEARRLSWKAELKMQKGEVKPENPEAEVKAKAFELEGRIARYRKVIALDPADVLGYFSLGSALLDAKRIEEARDAFRQAITVDPGHSPSYFNLGLALETLGQKEDAVSTYQKGVQVADRRGDMIPLKKMQSRLAMLTKG